MEQTIRHKVSGQIFTIRYEIVWMPIIFEPRGRKFRPAWRIR